MEKVPFAFLNHDDDIVDVFMHHADKCGVLLTFAQNILREPAELSSQDRETIATFVSNLNGCQFCTGSHRVFSISIGVDNQDIDTILDGNYQSHRLYPILEYVKKLTLTPSELNTSDYDFVINSGFSEEELSEAILVCAAFNLFNRVVEGHGIQKNENSWADDAKMINEFGYDLRYKK